MHMHEKRYIRAMPDRSSKRPTDPNQLAKLMVDITSGDVTDGLVDPQSGKNLAAVALGRLGGKIGGSARAAALTPERRKEIARAAASVRWRKDGNKSPSDN
jgi:hypothetical protein